MICIVLLCGIFLGTHYVLVCSYGFSLFHVLQMIGGRQMYDYTHHSIGFYVLRDVLIL